MAHVCPLTCVGFRYGFYKISSRRFSRHSVPDSFLAYARIALATGLNDQRICLSITPQRPGPHSKRPNQLKPCVTPSKSYRSAGILTCCPSTTPFGLVLGPTNPGTIRVALETLSLRWAGFSPALLLLMPTFSLLNAPRWVTPSASALFRMLLYRSHQ